VSSQFHSLWQRIEDAVNAHPAMRVADGQHPSFLIDYSGTEARIAIRRKNGRKAKVGEIISKASTPEEATTELIAMLDYWAGKL
jgi:hypothetical protein